MDALTITPPSLVFCRHQIANLVTGDSISLHSFCIGMSAHRCVNQNGWQWSPSINDSFVILLIAGQTKPWIQWNTEGEAAESKRAVGATEKCRSGVKFEKNEIFSNIFWGKLSTRQSLKLESKRAISITKLKHAYWVRVLLVCVYHTVLSKQRAYWDTLLECANAVGADKPVKYLDNGITFISVCLFLCKWKNNESATVTKNICAYLPAVLLPRSCSKYDCVTSYEWQLPVKRHSALIIFPD